jgi:hypothetical protein
MDKIKFTRAQLHELVWSESMLALSKKYNISDVGLRKTCLRMNIPIPKAGYWNKIHAGKLVSIEGLPIECFGEQEIILSLRKEGENADLKSPLIKLQKEIESHLNLLLIVPSKLISFDKLIIAARNTLMKQKPSRYGSDKGLVYCYRGELNIKGSPRNVERALCFMDAFIKLLRAIGHEVRVDTKTYAIIENEKTEISLKEKLKKVLIITGTSYLKKVDYSPSGILSLRIREGFDNIIEFKDGRLLIEKQLAKIIAKMEIKVKERKKRKLEIERYWTKQREKERIRLEIEKRKERELSDFKELIKEALRWSQTKLLRNYIDETEAKALASDTFSAEFTTWLLWARKKINWYDPHIHEDDELLKDVDRGNLTFIKK